MTIKSAHFSVADKPALIIILTLLALIFGMGIGAAVGTLLTQALDVNVAAIIKSGGDTPLGLEERNAIRWFNFVAHVFSFTFAAVVMAFLAKGEHSWRAFLQLDRGTRGRTVLLGLLLLVAALPLISFSNWLNANLPLPEWMLTMEDSQNWLVGEVLRMENFGELIVALLVAAVAPAIGEELLFRGVLQPQTQKLFGNNAHVGIWITAIVFSAIHLQFVGFFPRMLLGALLGYLLWWSGTLWVPILVHFLFNGTQVIGAYLYPEEVKIAANTTEIEMPAIWAVGLSVLAVVYLVRILYGERKKRELDTVDEVV